MTQGAKKITSYLLGLLIVGVTLISLLAIWEIVSLEDVMLKIVKSLLIIFGASVLTLFIYNVVLREATEKKEESIKE